MPVSWTCSRIKKSNWRFAKKSTRRENHFPEEDKFGYQATFRDYLSQAGSLRASTSQQNETIASQNAAASQTQAEIGNLISQTEAKIRDYQTAKSAIETGASLASQNLATPSTSPTSLRVRKIRKLKLRQLRRLKRSFSVRIQSCYLSCPICRFRYPASLCVRFK